MPTSRTERVVKEIMAGTHDAHLDEIVKAITAKLKMGHISTRWRVVCLGLDVAETDLTLDEAWHIEETTDTDWHAIDPVSTATHFRAMLRVLLRSRLGLDDAEIDERISTLTMIEAASGISRELVPGDDEEGRAPLVSVAPVTIS